jgi:hypothetical protein
MMPLRRSRGAVFFTADCDFERLRLNQPDPMSDINLSYPAGQVAYRRAMAQIIRMKGLRRDAAKPKWQVTPNNAEPPNDLSW